MKIDLDNLLPSCPEDTDIQHIELGEHRYPALVVDGFYRDPDLVRAFALALRYRAPASMHPGYAALASLPLEPFVSFVYGLLGHWYYASPEAMEKEGGACQFFRVEQRLHEPPRPASSRPHADIQLLSGMVYLTPPDECRGGTSFFRHVETGAQALLPKDLMKGRCPERPSHLWAVDEDCRDRIWRHGGCEPYEQALRDGRVSGYDEYFSRIMNTPGNEGGYILESCEGWDLLQTIEMKYNRLVVFPAFLLHSGHLHPEWFGATPEGCRLTQNFGFNWPARPQGIMNEASA
jgi:hypothetical protein